MREMDFSGDDGKMVVDENDRWIVHETNVAVLDEVNELRTKTKKNKANCGKARSVRGR